MFKYSKQTKIRKGFKYNDFLSFWWLTLPNLTGGKPYDIVSNLAGTQNGSPAMQYGKYSMYNFSGTSFEFGDTLPTQVTQTNFSMGCMMATTTNTGSFQGICGKGFLASSLGGYGIYCNGANCSGQTRSGGTTSVIDSSTSITDGNPHFVMLTRSPALTSLYVDGVLVGTETTALTVVNDTTNFCVGKNGPGSFPYTGRINDVRVWKNVTWSLADVKSIYQDILTGYQDSLEWDKTALFSLPAAVGGGANTNFFSLLFGGGF